MKTTIFSILLLFTISSGLVHSACTLGSGLDEIELQGDFTSEHESEEKTEIDEEVSEFTLESFELNFLNDGFSITIECLKHKMSDLHLKIPTPPPDSV